MIITISGTPGAGDTTITEMLSEEIGYEVVEVGEIYKKLAKEKELDPEELWKEQEKNPEELKEFHKELDERQVKIAKEKKNLILNGKLSAFKVKEADLKIFLTADLEERTRRIAMRNKIGRKEFAEKINKGEEVKEKPTEKEIEKAKEEIKKRQEKEVKHWKKLYGIDYISEKEAYDLIIDTTNRKPREVLEAIKRKSNKI